MFRTGEKLGSNFKTPGDEIGDSSVPIKSPEALIPEDFQLE
jgi:hypothetical protein